MFKICVLQHTKIVNYYSSKRSHKKCNKTVFHLANTLHKSSSGHKPKIHTIIRQKSLQST